jgi:hypothetical protein
MMLFMPIEDYFYMPDFSIRRDENSIISLGVEGYQPARILTRLNLNDLLQLK